MLFITASFSVSAFLMKGFHLQVTIHISGKAGFHAVFHIHMSNSPS